MSDELLKKELEAIREIFRVLGNSGFDSYAVCGGWVRDLVLAKPRKDIDVFVFIGEEIESSYKINLSMAIMSILNLSQFDFQETLNLDADYMRDCSFRDEVKNLVQLTSSDFGVDIIVCSGTYPEILNGFDSSICEIGMSEEDGEFKIKATESFMSGVKSDTIYEYSGVRVRDDHRLRLNNKYPEYKWVKLPSRPVTKLVDVQHSFIENK